MHVLQAELNKCRLDCQSACGFRLQILLAILLCICASVSVAVLLGHKEHWKRKAKESVYLIMI